MIPKSPARKNQTLSLLFASFNGTGLISQSPKYARMNLTKRISRGEKLPKRYFVDTNVIPQTKIAMTAKKRPSDFGQTEFFFMLPSKHKKTAVYKLGLKSQ